MMLHDCIDVVRLDLVRKELLEVSFYYSVSGSLKKITLVD